MIVAVDNKNLEDLLPLVRQYQTFYRVKEISDDKNRQFFSKFHLASEAGCQFLYRDSGKAVAFATVYFSYSSTIAAKVAVLNDVYTSPEYRGRGIARKLIEHCRAFAAHCGAARLQWVTAPDNIAAQSLYDSLATQKSTWHFYTYPTESQ